MSREDKLKVAMNLIDSFNAHSLHAWYAALADDYVAAYPLARHMNKEEARAYNQPFISAFPDLQFIVQRTLVDGDNVAIHWMAKGTHTQPLVPKSGETIPPTGKQIELNVMVVTEVKDGKIKREWTGWDQVEFLSQLGLM